MSARIARAEGGKQDGRKHADHTQGRGQTHVADQDAVEHGADDGSRRGLLGDLVGGGGNDVALERLVLFQRGDHIGDLEVLLLAEADEVLRLVVFRDTDADQHDTHEGEADAHPGHHIQELLVEVASEGGHQACIHDDVEHHGGQVIQDCLPDTDGGTLLRVIGHQGRQRLRGHVDDGVADDVEHVEAQEGGDAVSLAGEEIEHAQEARALDGPTQEHQRAHLAERCVDPVIDEGEQRIRHRVEDPGEGQQAADGHGGDAVADAGAVAGQADQEVDGHAVEGVEGHQNDLPEFRAAVLHSVRGAVQMIVCHDELSPFSDNNEEISVLYDTIVQRGASCRKCKNIR